MSSSSLRDAGHGGQVLLSLAAQELARDEPGVRLLDLGDRRLKDLSRPAGVPGAILAALGVQEGPKRSTAERPAECLRDREMLLLLDNFEQVVEAAPAVATLLAACPRLRVLVTSREPLRVRGERQYPVPLLGLPEAGRVPTLAQLGQYEAANLFIQRAVEVPPEFAVTSENAPAVAGICHRLEGASAAAPGAPERLRARALVGMGTLGGMYEDWQRGNGPLTQARELYRKLGDTWGEAFSLEMTGETSAWATMFRGTGLDSETARSMGKECASLYRKAGDMAGVGRTISWTGPDLQEWNRSWKTATTSPELRFVGIFPADFYREAEKLAAPSPSPWQERTPASSRSRTGTLRLLTGLAATWNGRRPATKMSSEASSKCSRSVRSP